MDDNAKRQAEVYETIAKSAWDRFDSRRDVEWKCAIGIWTVFGAGSFAVLNSNATLHWASILISLVAAIVAVSFYYRFWLSYISETMRRDMLTSYFWEMQIQRLTTKTLPEILDPKHGQSSKSDLWEHVAVKVDSTDLQPLSDEERKRLLAAMKETHRSQTYQLVMAIVFAGFFVCAVSMKVLQPTPTANPRITIEGSFETEAATKVKLGN